MTSLYRFYNDTGRLLYVGITKHLPRRLSEHSWSKNWWTEVMRIDVEHFDDRSDARAAELHAIRTERPEYNIADVPTDGDRFWYERVADGWDRLCAHEPAMRDMLELVRTISACWSGPDWCAVGWWMGSDHIERLLAALVGWHRINPTNDDWLRSSDAYDIAWSVLYWTSTPGCRHPEDQLCAPVTPEGVDGAVRSLATPYLADLWERSAADLKVVGQ